MEAGASAPGGGRRDTVCARSATALVKGTRAELVKSLKELLRRGGVRLGGGKKTAAAPLGCEDEPNFLSTSVLALRRAERL